MKKLIGFVLIIVIAYFATQYGPWYLVAVAGFIGGLFINNQWQGLILGFLAGFGLWIIQVYLLQQASTSDLPERMAQLFGLSSNTSLMLVTATVGGLMTGFGTAAGGALTQKKKKKRRRRY